MSRHKFSDRMVRLTLFSIAAGLLTATGTAAEIDILSAPSAVIAGQQFTVSVYVSGITDLYGYGFDLGFDPGRVQELSASESAFLGLGGPTFHIDGSVDNVGGVVSGVANSLEGDVPGVDGSGMLESFVFKATAAGSAGFTLANVTLLDSQNEDITPAVVGSETTITGGGHSVPEPAPLSLVALGVAALWMMRRPAAR